MSLIKNPKGKTPFEVFGLTEKEIINSNNSKIHAVTAIYSCFKIMSVEARFACIAVLEITTGLTNLRYDENMIEYFENSLNEKELMELATMLVVLVEVSENELR